MAVAAALTVLAATPASARPVHGGGAYHGGGYYGGGGYYHGGGYYRGGYYGGYNRGYYGYGYRPYSYGGYYPYYGYAYARPYYPYYGGTTVYNYDYAPDVYSYGVPGPSTAQSFYGPSDTTVTPSSAVAGVRVHVPDPNAELWFNDTPMRQRGEWRSFETPTLTPGKDYSYDARVRWTDPASGAVKEETRHVTVHAGENVTVDFTRPA
jgi:uncharacterized protein (TIGR03000 family)